MFNRKLKEELVELKATNHALTIDLGHNKALLERSEKAHHETYTVLESVRGQVIDLTNQLSTWKEVAESQDKSRVEWMRKAEELEGEVTQMTNQYTSWKETAEGLRKELTDMHSDLHGQVESVTTELNAYKTSHAGLIEERDQAQRVAEGYRKEWEAARSLADDRTDVLNNLMEANDSLKEQLTQANDKIAELEKSRPNRGNNGRFQPKNRAKK